MTGGMRRRFAFGVVAMGYSKLAAAFVQLGLIPLLALHWGLALYGQWLLIVTVPMFFASSDFGLSTAASNRIIAEVARDEPDEALVTFQSANKMILAISGGLAAVAALAALLVPDRLLAVAGGMSGEEARIVLLIMIAYGATTMQDFLYSGVLRAQGRQALTMALRASTTMIEGIAVAAAVLLGAGPLVAACCFLAIRVIGIASQVIASLRFAPWLRLDFRMATGERLRALWRPAVAAMMVPLAYAIYLQGSALAIGIAAGPATVPLYTSVRTAARLWMQITNMVVIPVMPEVTAAHGQGNRRRLARLGGVLVAANGIAGPAFGAVIVFLGAPLVHIWTKGAIQPPQTMITLVGIGLVFAILWNPIASLLLAINRHETYSYVFGGASVAAVALTYVLTLQFGVTGAAAAGLALDAGMFAVVLVCLRREIGHLEFSRSALKAVLPERWRANLG